MSTTAASPRVEPLEPKSGFVEANGIRLAYEERGTGEPLVLVSGIGMQLVSWPPGLLDGLARRGLRVIVFDNRDVGLSTRLTAAGVPPLRSMLLRAALGLPVTAPYTLFDMADDVAGLLDALGLRRAHVAGASLGGMVAQAVAIRHGHRLKSVIPMMTHAGGRLLGAGRPRAVLKLLRPPPRSREEAMTWQVEFFRTAGSTGFFRDDDALATRAGIAYDRAFHPPGFARQFAAVLATGDMRPRLRAVRVPALVLHGSVDPIFLASRGHEIARAIPGSVFQLIEGWGHDLAEGVADLLVRSIAEHVAANAG